MNARLVRQTLDEQRRDFTRGGDPAEAMDVGLRRKIREWLEKMGIQGYRINEDRSIDVVDDCVYLHGRDLSEFPNYVKFGKVDGYFSCSHNDLISLEGCPETVGGSFSCDHNALVSLEGCPKTVDGNFYCRNNRKRFTEEEVRSFCDVKGEIRVK